MKDECFQIAKGPPCFVQLGKIGDLLILFPAFKAVYDRTGFKPVVMVSTAYANLFDGISYARPWSVNVNWWSGIEEARAQARGRFSNIVVPHFWNDESTHDEFSMKHFREGFVTLQCHGVGWGVDINRWPNFMTSMWDRAGFTREEMMTLPLVFDRRDRNREQALAQKYLKPGIPNVLYNLQGVSSPFVHSPEVQSVLREFKRVAHLVDLARIKAPRFYDLLGLYERSAGLITVDTSTLHLGNASRIPMFCYTRDGWCGSFPRGNVKGDVKYSRVLEQLNDLREYLKGILK